jgi:3-oxoadipate enol-lactonase
VLLHAGIADARMWKPQLATLAKAGYRAIAVDLPCFGGSECPAGEATPRAEVLSHLETLGVDRFAVVGASIGARIALEIAVAAPHRVTALLLAAPGIDVTWSEDVKRRFAQEEEAWKRGDLEAATDVGLRMWLGEGSPIAGLVRPMALDGARLQYGVDYRWAHDPPDPERVACPTLVVIGNRDIHELNAAARHLAERIPGARQAALPTAHLPNLEAPDAFDRLLLDLLAGGIKPRTTTGS